MKKTLLISCILLLSNVIHAQKKVYEEIQLAKKTAAISNYGLFSKSSRIQNFEELKTTAEFAQLDLEIANMKAIRAENPQFLTLSVPFNSTNQFDLELIPLNIYGETYQVLNGKNEVVNLPKSIHYKGIVKDDKNSLVSLSITDGEVSGIISTNLGNFVLGKLKSSSTYIVYNDRDLLNKPAFECGVMETNAVKIMKEDVQDQLTLAPNVACRAVQIYFEADKAIYTAQGSNITTATNFCNSLFAQVAVLYNNEGIVIQMSQLKVWDVDDPYLSATTTNQMLNAFGTQVGTTFTGDLAHLISGRSLGGGVAWLNVLCSKGTGISASINSAVVNIPTYSWNVEVVTHEMGHNFGSPHTHSCSWPGGAIDNCYTTEGGCPAGAAPVNGGTIMSYCHLSAPGINFNNGFGTLPSNLIRSRTQSCLGSAVTPDNLANIDIYSTTAFLGWNHPTNGPFTFEYRTGSGSWIISNTSSKNITLTSLTPNTTYEWRVKTNCSTTYANKTFTTNTTTPISWCSPNYSAGCSLNYGFAINSFQLNGVTLNENSECNSGNFSIVSNPILNLNVGQTYNFTINLYGYWNDERVTMWIDYNKNGTFETSEKVFNTTSNSAAAISGSFTVPAGISVANTRIRVILSSGSTSPTNPCGSYIYGETEDYLVNIVNCVQTLTLQNPADNISTGAVIKQAAATNGVINATNLITGTGTRATYQAKAINLNNGFRADSGTIFSAVVGGCSN